MSFLNSFSLTPLEKKSILEDSKELASQMTLDIFYYDEDNDWQPGYSSYDNNENGSKWIVQEDIKCTPREIGEREINYYDFGNAEEGDLVLILPYDTQLKKTDKYKIYYLEKEYISKTGMQPYKPKAGLLMFYIITF